MRHYIRRAPGYPAGLEHLAQPPETLYTRGPLPDRPGIAVVGTRKISPYGLQCVGLLVPEIVRLGFAVVSGLAFGVDAAAHEATLDAGGQTAAVIAGGVDDHSITPRSHFGLAKRLFGAGGCVLSEYPPGTESYKEHFPARNRIIAALSAAVLVIEAPRKSGAMITARLALEIGREVWAVPGPITHPNAWGPNELIKNGATPITGPEDIAHALGFEPVQQRLFSALPEEQRVLDHLKHAPASIDELARELRNEARSVSALLSKLELENRVRSVGGGRFTLYTVP